MQNIDVRFNASSSFAKVEADLAALKAQAASLNAVFEKGAYAKMPAIVDPASWRQATAAVNTASRAYRDAASSSGLFNTQQIRSVSEAEKYTKAMQKQKLGMQDMFKHRGIMKEMYNDQLRYQRMTAQYWGTDSKGRAITDIAIPKNVPRDLDSIGTKMRFFGSMASSASNQIVNLGKNIQWSGRQLTVGFTYPMALFGAAAGMMAYKVEDAFGSINKVYDYSAAALTDQNKLIKEQGELRTSSMNMANEVAQRYGLTVQKTLAVEQQLAATGLKGKILMDSTKEVQRISALGDIDPTMTTDMVVSLQTAFKDTIKDGDDLTRTLNFMNATSNATSLSLQDIAEATPRAASGLAQLGVTADEMTIMLVSMREAGVDAAEGANALKSATTRILNPVAKATEFYKKYGISIQKISEDSGGNLYKFLGMLGKEQTKINGSTAEQTKRMRAQGIAALFGTYQFNRLNAALVNLSDAQAGNVDGANQTRKAIDLQSESVQSLAHMAKISEKAMMETPAAKFRKEWASFQIQLAEMGTPFLEAASKVLGVFADISEWFNGLGDGTRKFALFTAAFLASVGPVIMTLGLLTNLSGQFGKGIGVLSSLTGRLAGGVGLVTKEEKAAALTTEMANKAYSQQSAATATLTQEVRVLTAAYEKAGMAIQNMILLGGENAASMGQQAQQAARAAMAIGPQTQTLKSGYQLTSQEQSYYNATSAHGANGQFLSQQVRLEQARNKLAHDYMLSNNQAARDASKTVKNIAVENRTRAAIKENINGANIGMTAMGASMAAMMVSSNQTVDNVAKWIMISTMAVPAMKMVVSQSLSLASGMATAMTTARNASVATTAIGTGLVMARSGAIGFGVALNAALGPIGWITLGLTAAAGVFLAIKHHNDEIEKKRKALLKEEINANVALQNSSAIIAQNLGKAAGAYGQIVSNYNGGSEASGSELLNRYNYYKSDEGKGAVNGLKSLDDEALMLKLHEQYIDLQVVAGLTAKQAKTELQAMLLAVGRSSSEATALVESTYNRLGEVSKLDWAVPLREQIAQLRLSMKDDIADGSDDGWFSTKITDGDAKRLKTEASKASQIFNQAMLEAKEKNDHDAMTSYVDTYLTSSLAEWQAGFQHIMDISEKDLAGATNVKDIFAKYGIDSGKAFADAWRNNSDFKKSIEDITGPNSGLLSNLVSGFATKGAKYETIQISALAAASATLNDEIKTAPTAWAAFGAAGQTNLKAAQDSVFNTTVSLRAMKLMLSRTTEGSATNLRLQEEFAKKNQSAMASVNELNRAFGFKEGKTGLEAINNLMNEIKADAKGAKNDVDGVVIGLRGLPSRIDISIHSTEDFLSAAKTSMSNVQSAMADSAMTKFNNNWDASMDAAQSSWDARIDAQSRAQDAAMDRFDARWDRRKDAVDKSYQKRIEAINNEIKAEQKANDTRQRIFEQEKTRLQRLAELENNTIDFNTAVNEGRLDDAAKIQNNATASTATAQMDQEQKAAEALAQEKIDRLEKKNAQLEKQRDAEMKKLEKMEEQQRKSLERMNERKAAALKASSEADMAAIKKTRDYEEASLQQRLELFKAFIPRTKKELDIWIKQTGLSYDVFGQNMTKKGKSWSTTIADSLRDQVIQAGAAIASDAAWEGLGKSMATKILKGIGFSSLEDFNKFVTTGQMPKPKSSSNNHTRSGGGVETRHEGGVIGSGKGSRGNIPNTYKGLHRTETMVRAQAGEYMVNRDASRKNLGLLQRINSGEDVTKPSSLPGFGSPNEGRGAGGPGLSGLLAGAIAQMYGKGLSAGMQQGLNKNIMSKSSVFGNYGTLGAGKYGGTTFSAEQLKNAQTIANVGSSMGMSSRDVVIGLMTAMQESMLRNITYGDRDSLGLFQQRPSQGWGTPEQVTNPQYAARKFFEGLKGVEGRNNMPLTMAAQAVQRSAYPTAYAKWEDEAEAMVKAMKSSGGKLLSSNVFSGPGGKSNGIGRNAIDWAAPHLGDYGWSGLCQKFVRMAFGAPAGFPSAISAWNGAKMKHSGDRNPPAGVPVYFTPGANGLGHVALHTGGGRVISTDYPQSGRVGSGTIGGIESAWNRRYLGWTGDINGKVVYPGLKKGGQIRYDNTIANLHRGETVLTAPLTKQFKDNVASNGSNVYHMTIDLRGSSIKEDVDIKRAVKEAMYEIDAKTGRKRIVK